VCAEYWAFDYFDYSNRLYANGALNPHRLQAMQRYEALPSESSDRNLGIDTAY
jgi:hypothetical protein